MAAGGFVNRAFESMLKESSGKKYADLQKAIQAFLESTNVASHSSTSKEKNPAVAVVGDSSPELDGGHTRHGSINGLNVATILANVGYTLEGADAELVLSPLRFAFDTKNLKIVELALDCLHKLIAYDHLEGDPGLDGGKNASLFTGILNMVCNCVDNSFPDSTILQVLKVLLTSVASSKFKVHGELLLGIFRACYNIALHSKGTVNQATSKAMLTQMIGIIFHRMEANSENTTFETEYANIVRIHSIHQKNEEIASEGTMNQFDEIPLTSVEELLDLAGGADIKGLEAILDKAIPADDSRRMTRGIDLDAMNIGQQDALLVFRTLCKMGMKEDTDEVTIRTRILSLELIQGLLEGIEESFVKNFHFIDSVKSHVSYVLLRASISRSPIIFQYATGIFSMFLLRFRESLKIEVGIFFPIIVFQTLDSVECSFSQRISVLRMLNFVCQDPQMLIDLYVNYDCDFHAPNLFERMVSTLSKIAQGTHNADSNSVSVSTSASIKALALQCLLIVLKSLVEWEKSHREIHKKNKSNQLLEEVVVGESFDLNSSQVSCSSFEKEKAQKSPLEASISEFNRQPVKGIECLISHQLVDNNPVSVAQFLRSTPNLDKARIGDYLGQHEEFPVSVMHAYVDSMNFSGMKFDRAIRVFLEGFFLPGEAQKIDRIMEKFAERYDADNPEVFQSADTAYVLAYTVIMLNADAHDPMAWPKMSKSDFVRMNSVDIADVAAPEDLLNEIYDSIVMEEIKMKAELAGIGEGSIAGILNLAPPKRKLLANAESENVDPIKQTQAIFRKHGGRRGTFYVVEQMEIVGPMIESLGWPLLATFSVTMEEGENKPRVVLCMEGFKVGIHITHVLGMDTMRYAFLTSLLRFTFLHAPKEMRGKNVEALRTLLSLCDLEIDSLRDTWNAVLECVSRLNFITSTPSVAATVMYGSNQISREAILQSLQELAGKPSEQIFTNSVNLPSEAVIEFFTALCGVSTEELKQTPARVFCLQKLIEISYYNMTRIRMVWSRIWHVLANHFVVAGSHHDVKIAKYTIDSLRQLAMKYLERAEPTNFTFQNDILKPFVFLMKNSQIQFTRKLIVDSMVQLIKSKVGSIKSGWHSIFMVFTAAADDESELIIESAFENVEQVVLEHFDQVIGDCFADCVNCLIRFANNKSCNRISLKAIALLRICEDRLAEGLIPGGAVRPVGDQTERYWFPMLAGLSDLTLDPRPEVRGCSLEVLFDLLNERGKTFSSSFWESIFLRVLFPIFDHMRHAGRESLLDSDDGILETRIHSLQLLCNVFNTFYKEVCFMLPPLLGLLLDCAKLADQTVVSISLGALVHLIEVGGHQFSENDWDVLLNNIRDASYTTQPLELLNSESLEMPKGAAVLFTKSEKIVEKSMDEPRVNVKLCEEMAKEQPIVEHNQEPESPSNLETQSPKPSPSGRGQSPPDDVDTQRSQTSSQKFLGTMIDSLFLRSTSSKPKNVTSDVSSPSSIEIPGPPEDDINGFKENPLRETISGKCITQLLLLGAIDSIQKKYWRKLKPSQKISIMEVLLSMLEFAASYNSYPNLRLRLHLDAAAERPPQNMLHQELVGTSIYLDVLQKTTCGKRSLEDQLESVTAEDVADSVGSNSTVVGKNSDELGLERVAEEKFVSLCEEVLTGASDLQSTTLEMPNLDVHRVLEMRSPVIVKVLNSMCLMNNHIFKRHLREFYPLLTKLVCCDQMNVRGALADLFQSQLAILLS